MTSTNPTVVITGASGNLGRATAAAFARHGARLVLIDRGHTACPEGVTGAEYLSTATDLMDAAAVEAAIAEAVSRFGRIDVVCNLVGGFRMGEAVHETTDATWDFLVDLNARTLVHVARAVVPRLTAQGGGKIVNVAATAARRGLPRMGVYCATKDMVVRLTEAMSAELKASNINVNCVLPSIIDTPENRSAMPDADSSQWVAPEALADVIVFLASHDARSIHGASLPVEGLV